MEKLQFKDIAPYLPYGLKARCDKKTYRQKSKYRIGIINYWHSECDEISISTETGYYLCEISECKPILHKLSDLTKEIEVNGEIINPLYEIMSDSWIVGDLNYIKTEHRIIIKDKENVEDLIIYTTKPNVNMWWVTQKLIEMHFDTNNLIEKGLAIDKNTL